MKRYKLLKDLSTFKAGDLFYISEHGALVRDDGVMAYTQRTLDMLPNSLTEWFEEIKEPTDSTYWKPKKGEKYWISHLGGNVSYLIWSDYPDDYNYLPST